MTHLYEEVELERQRAIPRPAPRKYGGPLTPEAEAPTADCPVCHQAAPLNMAGRMQSHAHGQHICAGTGRLPGSDEDAPAQVEPVGSRIIAVDRRSWWSHPTCQDCGRSLSDRGKLRWDVTKDIRFVCAGGCRELRSFQ